jgi:hypothetical protein
VTKPQTSNGRVGARVNFGSATAAARSARTCDGDVDVEHQTPTHVLDEVTAERGTDGGSEHDAQAIHPHCSADLLAGTMRYTIVSVTTGSKPPGSPGLPGKRSSC